MPYRSSSYWRVVMTFVRSFLSWSYLWVMVEAAALIPVLHGEKKTLLFWTTRSQYSLTYRSLLPFDGFTQGFVLVMMLKMMTRLFQCCRCFFFGGANVEHELGRRIVRPFDWSLLIYAGPYIASVVGVWCISVYCIFDIMLQVCVDPPTRNRTALYCELAMAMIFKVFVLANAIARQMRIIILLKLFNQEPEAFIHNEHNFGEHLNLFFQN